MKRLFTAMLAVGICLTFVCCGEAGEDKNEYGLYFAVDKGERGLRLYAITEEISKDKASSKTKHCEYYDGGGLEEVFGEFFRRHKGIYTGTVREYAVWSGFGEKMNHSLWRFLLNSSELSPQKAILQKQDPYEYVLEKLNEWDN